MRCPPLYTPKRHPPSTLGPGDEGRRESTPKGGLDRIKGPVVVFPYGVIARRPNHLHHLFGGAEIFNLKLLQDFLATGGVTARSGAGAGAHGRNAQGNQLIPEGGRLAGREIKAHFRQEETQGQHALHQITIPHEIPHGITLRRVKQPGEGDRKGGLPAVLLEVSCVEPDPQEFLLPLIEAQQGTNTQIAHPGLTRPLRSVEAVVIDRFLPFEVDLAVGGPVVGLHVERHPFEARFHKFHIVGFIDRIDLDGDPAEVLPGNGDGLGDIIHRNSLGRFPGQDQHVLITHTGKGFALFPNQLRLERDPLLLIARTHGKSAIHTVRGTKVRDIEGRVEGNRAAKMPSGKPVRLLRHGLQIRLGRSREQGPQIGHAELVFGQGTFYVGRRRLAVEGQET